MVVFIEYDDIFPHCSHLVTEIANALGELDDESMVLLHYINSNWNSDEVLAQFHNPQVWKALRDTTLSRCELCLLESDEVEKKPNPLCGHICTDHLNVYLESTIRDGHLNLMCSHCDIQYPTSFIKDAVVLDIYKKTIAKSFAIYKKMRHCPNSECSMTVLVPDTEVVFALECPSCNTRFCPACGTADHWPSTCVDHLRFTFRASANPTRRPCLRCGDLYFRDYGCDHIICPQKSCGYEYCWNCLNPYSLDHVCLVEEVGYTFKLNQALNFIDLLHERYDNFGYMVGERLKVYEPRSHWYRKSSTLISSAMNVLENLAVIELYNTERGALFNPYKQDLDVKFQLLIQHWYEFDSEFLNEIALIKKCKVLMSSITALHSVWSVSMGLYNLPLTYLCLDDFSEFY